jgi:hypothetical protein
MKNETNKPAVEKEKATVPPRRGQIKANIFKELVEGVIAITTGETGKKSEECGGESSSHEKKQV